MTKKQVILHKGERKIVFFKSNRNFASVNGINHFTGQGKVCETKIVEADHNFAASPKTYQICYDHGT